MSAKLDNLIQTFNNLEHKTRLYLKFPDKFQIPDNPREFLYLFLTDYNNKYLTYDKEKEEKENWNYPLTQKGLRRSINEVYDILTNYFPNYTVLEYFQDIYSVIHQIFESGGTVLCHYCSTIQRYVFLINGRHYKEFLDEGNLDNTNKNFPYHFVWKRTGGLRFPQQPELWHELWNDFNNPEICLELTGGKYIVKDKNKKLDKQDLGDIVSTTSPLATFSYA